LIEKNVPILQRFLREPLLHFIVIGGLFFLIYTAVNDTFDISTDTNFITPERIDQIETIFTGVWNRKPTDEELDNLIKEEVRSEVYYRDALALGLDKNDAIVRRRLRQKMEFLTDTGIYLQEPSPGELETYFAANEQVYKNEPRLAFEQVYLGESPPEDSVSQTLKMLRSESAVDPSTLGQHTLLPAQLKMSQPGAIDSVFGKGFYSQIAVLAPGEWVGPVTSTYGIHLIRTLDGEPARMPPLEEIRDFVLQDWRSAKAEENRQQDYAKRRSRYTVEIIRRMNVAETESR
jgi:hypothetical protein